MPCEQGVRLSGEVRAIWALRSLSSRQAIPLLLVWWEGGLPHLSCTTRTEPLRLSTVV